MLARIRSHVRRNLVAYLALIIALSSGGAYASHLVVRSSDIVNGAVKTVDLGRGAVKAEKLGRGAVTGAKVLNGSLTEADLATLPHAKARQTSAQSIPNNNVSASNKVNLDQLEFGSGLTLSNNELTVTTPGVYSVTGTITWEPNGTGGRALEVTRNDIGLRGTDLVQAAPSSFGVTAHSVTVLARFDVGDRIALFVGQNSGGPLSTFVVGGSGAALSAHWVSP
jgi:hypothetical protein